LKPVNEIGVFVKLKCQSRTINTWYQMFHTWPNSWRQLQCSRRKSTKWFVQSKWYQRFLQL